MYPKLLLRAEGLVIALFAAIAYFTLGGLWWLFLGLFLAPDLSMLGYLAGARYGSMAYNLAHTYLGPAAVGALGLWMGVDLAVLVGLIWTAHIGFDRVVGYGLKYETRFSDTHLSRLSTFPDPVQGSPGIEPVD